MCAGLKFQYVYSSFIHFSLFWCVFVFIWVSITRTQKQKEHTLLQIHKAPQIRSDHLGQNFWKNYWVSVLNGSQARYWIPAYSNKNTFMFIIRWGPTRGLCLFSSYWLKSLYKSSILGHWTSSTLENRKKIKDQFGDCQTGLKNMSSVWHNYMLTYFLNYSFIK